jgi:hypothetical protein
MKIKTKTKLINNLWKVFSFFKWRECNVCGDSFIRESGWEARISENHKIYMCKSCIPTVREANEYISKHKYLPKRSDSLPSPPSKNFSIYDRR